MFQSSLRLSPWLHGVLLGFFVWLLGTVILWPRMKIAQPPLDRPLNELATSILSHLAFGVTSALVYNQIADD